MEHQEAQQRQEPLLQPHLHTAYRPLRKRQIAQLKCLRVEFCLVSRLNHAGFLPASYLRLIPLECARTQSQQLFYVR